MKPIRSFASAVYYSLTVLLFCLIAALVLCAPAFAQDAADPTADPVTPKSTASNPQMRAVLDAWAFLEPQPIEMLDPSSARKQPTLANAVEKVLEKARKSDEPEAVGSIDNRKIPYQPEDIRVRVYTPLGNGPFPVIVYYHGGGFVIGSLDVYDASCRALCNAAGAIVVSVDYRLAPENKYPAAVNDAFAAYEWVTANAASISGDPAKIAVAGESAGGNLATVTSLMAAEKNVQKPVFQLLVYPLVDDNMDTESYKENLGVTPLSRAMMRWFFGHYLADPKSAADVHVSPLKASEAQLKQLPPTMIIAAQMDPLRSEGKAFADKLKAAGVPVEYKLYDGMYHEFFGLGAVVDAAKMAQTDAGAALRKAFAK